MGIYMSVGQNHKLSNDSCCYIYDLKTVYYFIQYKNLISNRAKIFMRIHHVNA